MNLASFNALPPAEAADVVRVWAAIPTWVDTVVAARPFASVDDAVAVATTAAAAWTAADLDQALAHHPRIGQRPAGAGAEADASRREQASMAGAVAATSAAIASANAVYEARFGRVFLIRAAGRSPDEMLAEATRRLRNDAATEATEALEQLRQIAVLRLQTTFEGDDA